MLSGHVSADIDARESTHWREEQRGVRPFRGTSGAEVWRKYIHPMVGRVDSQPFFASDLPAVLRFPPDDLNIVGWTTQTLIYIGHSFNDPNYWLRSHQPSAAGAQIPCESRIHDPSRLRDGDCAGFRDKLRKLTLGWFMNEGDRDEHQFGPSRQSHLRFVILYLTAK